YIELGRGSGFAVSYGEDCRTVSRPHAAIVRRGDIWVLKPLSKNNPTLLNKSPVRDEAPLRNGDEIQLSYEGPKLLFLLPPNNLVGTLGMTARMRAVMNEGVRPYRKAITLIILLFLVVTGGLGWYIYHQGEAYKVDIARVREEARHNLDAIRKESADTIAAMKKALLSATQLRTDRTTPNHHSPSADEGAAPSALKDLYPGVYYLRTAKVVMDVDGKQMEAKYAISGTGFLLNDGRFVTARHVVQPWFFLESGASDLEKALNIVASNGGKVTHYFTAYSTDGQQIELNGDEFTVNNEEDETEKVTLESGEELNSRVAHPSDKDWAVARLSSSMHTGLVCDREMSRNLHASSQVFALGFPFGIGANGQGDIHPSYGPCTVSMDGLNKGVIMVSGRSFDHGDSGGPVFAFADNKYYVVGIVSAGAGAQGIIVPVSALP
ncbi:MAG TPA: trypsin-like peptidase domain-containing protein, partial [Puia sp.]|nr:trypsin-like peptidase domain-containing protein [Puia sp.]